MQKYETEFEGYEFLKYSVGDEIVTSKTHKINISKVRIINIHNKILKMSPNKSYFMISVHGSRYLHRVVWEHVNGKISDDLEIDHIDNNTSNNKIENLQLLTHQDNLLKAAKNRNYDFIGDNHKNKHTVKVIDTNTKDIQICPSLYSAGLYCGVNCGIIKMCCDKINNCKSGISKTNNHKYTFEYTNEAPTIINKRFGRLYKAEDSTALNLKFIQDNKTKKKMSIFIDKIEKDYENLRQLLNSTETQFQNLIKFLPQ